MTGHILMKLIAGPRDTDDIGKITGSEVKVTENIFQKYGF